MNVDRIKSLGWEPKLSLKEGIKQTYDWYLENEKDTWFFKKTMELGYEPWMKLEDKKWRHKLNPDFTTGSGVLLLSQYSQVKCMLDLAIVRCQGVLIGS